MVTSGKDRSRKGKVLKAFPETNQILVEGLNVKKKTIRPRRSGEKGEIVQMPFPFNVANVKLVCPKCNQPSRVGYKLAEKKKFRICKKCGQEI